MCNYCSNSTPQIDVKSITQISSHILNITWFLKNPIFNISQVEFKYRENETSHIPHNCKLLSSTHDVKLTDEIYSTVDCRGLIVGMKYVLIGTITNHFNCTRVVSKNFTGKFSICLKKNSFNCVIFAAVLFDNTEVIMRFKLEFKTQQNWYFSA